MRACMATTTTGENNSQRTYFGLEMPKKIDSIKLIYSNKLQQYLSKIKRNGKQLLYSL